MAKARWPRRRASGNSPMKAASRSRVAVRVISVCGLPLASTRPASMATSQSKDSASSM